MELAEVVGQLAGLRRFPVRSLSGETPDECLMQGGGLVGDRIYEMVEIESGAPLSARTAPLLLRYRARYLDAMVRPGDLEPWIRIRTPDGAEVALSDRSWIDDVSRRCDRPVSLRLRQDADGDPAPVHLISVPTIRFLERQYGGTLEPVRLRSNLLLDLPDARPFEEDRWLGRKIWIGDALLEIVRQCEFCVVPSLDAETPERSPGILNAIIRGRGGLIGVRARALTGSRMRLGDPIAIVD
jgi:MOSC domain-containing protein